MRTVTATARIVTITVLLQYKAKTYNKLFVPGMRCNATQRKKVFVFYFCLLKYTNKSEGFPTREQATYSCPCLKHGFSKFSPHTITSFLK